MSHKKNPTIIEIKKTFRPVLRARGVRNAYLFGSVSRGETTKRSDIDIAVTFFRTPSLFELAALRLELTDVYHTPVDLVMKKTMHPRIRHAAQKDFIRIV